MVGGASGALVGIFSGPFAMLGFMWLENYLRGTMFYGLELIGSPVVGAVLGAIEGAFLGAVWMFLTRPPRRLTIARLMLIVAVSGPSLALVVADLPSALLILGNGLLILPTTILVLARVVQRHEEAARSARREQIDART
jgi:hypothetical protein